MPTRSCGAADEFDQVVSDGLLEFECDRREGICNGGCIRMRELVYTAVNSTGGRALQPQLLSGVALVHTELELAVVLHGELITFTPRQVTFEPRIIWRGNFWSQVMVVFSDPE